MYIDICMYPCAYTYIYRFLYLRSKDQTIKRKFTKPLNVFTGWISDTHNVGIKISQMCK